MRGLRDVPWRRLGLGLLAAILVELVVFDFRYFLPRLAGAPVLVLGPETLVPDTNAEVVPEGVRVAAEGVIEVRDVGVPVFSVTPITDPAAVYAVEVSFTDASSRNALRKTGVYLVDGSVYGSSTVSAVTAGPGARLRLAFPMARDRGLVLEGLVLNAPPLRFDPLRVLGMLALFGAVDAVRRRAPWARPAGPRVIPAVGLAGIAVLVAIALGAPPPPGAVAKGNDDYQLLTEAFARGQLHLPVAPPRGLAALDNPYDPSQRAKLGSPKPLWDVAYYKGKYYAYFGAAPAVIALLPARLLTGRPLPTHIAVLGFVVVAAVATLDLYRRLLARYLPGRDALTVAAGALALVLGSNLSWLVGRAKFYELAVAAGIAFLFVGLDLFAAARRDGPGAHRPLALAGLAFGLMVASRPNLVPYLGIVVPALLLDARRGDARRLAAFGAPLAAIGALVMAYNHARFGSPFEFGARYQLTLADQRWNGVGQLSTLVPGLFSYLAQPMAIDLHFPFFHLAPAEEAPTWTPQYQFRGPVLGLVWAPVLWPLIALPALAPSLRVAAYAALAGAAAVLVIDVGLAGVAMRYALDVWPVLTFGGVLGGVAAVAWLDARGAGPVAARGFAALVALTVVPSTAIGWMSESRWFANAHPGLMHRLELLFAFWR